MNKVIFSKVRTDPPTPLFARLTHVQNMSAPPIIGFNFRRRWHHGAAQLELVTYPEAWAAANSLPSFLVGHVLAPHAMRAYCLSPSTLTHAERTCPRCVSTTTAGC